MICSCRPLNCTPHRRLGTIVARVRNEQCLLHGTMLDGVADAVTEALDASPIKAAVRGADERWPDTPGEPIRMVDG